MKAVVMAGGEGTRLRPLTSNQPKPMVPIVGKPCMEHIIELLKAHGFEDVIVTVAFLPQSIRSYFGNGESIGANIEYSVEESPAGTAGSVRLASDYLDDTFIVISGDALCDFDLTRLVEFHKEKGSAATLALKSVENPLEFGIVVTDSDGRVERFLEKPSWSQVFSDTINTGVYVIEPEVLNHVPTDRPYDFSKELFPLLLEMGRPLYGHVVEGYWQDIGNLGAVPPGELRRPRPARPPRHSRCPAPRQPLPRGGRGDRRHRADRGAGVPRQLLPDRRGRDRRAVLGALLERDPARPGANGRVGDRRLDAHRPQRADRERDHRPQLRHPVARSHPRGRCGRRRGQDRRRERRHARACGSSPSRRWSRARRSTRT